MRPSLRRALLVVFITACGGSGSESSERASAPLEPTVRDSSGVTIYEHPADALERAPLITMDSVPLAVIGGAELENDVTRVQTVVMLSDGRVAGFDAEQGAVRIWGAAGDEVATHGRRGEGPGEFGRFIVTLAWAPGDTLVISDVSNSRITVVAPDSGVIRQQPALLRNDGELYNAAGRLDDGSVVLAPSNMIAARSAGDEQPPRRAPLAVGVVTPSSVVDAFDTLTVIPGTEMMRYRNRFMGREELMDGVPIFGARSIVTGWDGTAAVMTNERWDVRRHDSRGNLVAIVRVATPLRVANDSVFRLWSESMLASVRERAATDTARGAQMLEEAEFTVANMARADSVPPFTAAYRTAGKALWLMEYPVVRSGPLTFHALHADGRFLGTLVLPPMTRVVAFGDDRVVIRQEDDDGIVTFAVHRLRIP